MARVTARALLLVLLAAAAGCGEDPAPQVDASPEPTEAIRWGTTEFADLRVTLPETFGEKWVRHETEVHYLGPSIDGFQVQLQVLWFPSDRPYSEWVESRVSKVRDGPFQELLGEGTGRVGPWPAHTVVFRWIDNRKVPITNIDYYFAGGGHLGMLRGVVPTSHFLAYRPVFDAIAAGVAYADPDR